MKASDVDEHYHIVDMLFGSHLYGLQTENSDKDYKGIYLPPIRNLLLGDYAKSYNYSTGDDKSRNTAEDVDTEIYALPYFVTMACKGETFTLDMLHCTSPERSTWVWSQLINNRQKFYTKDMKSYFGYVRKQAAKYGLRGSRLADIKKAIEFFERVQDKSLTLSELKLLSPFPRGDYLRWTMYKGRGAGSVEQEFYEVNTKKYQTTNTVEYVLEQLTKMWDGYGERAKLAETNEGVDWKAVSHALRAGYQARDIYKEGDFEYPLKETEFLLAVKQGQLDYKKEVAPALESLVDEVNVLSSKSTLPSKVDKAWWDNWLLSIYEEFYLGDGFV